MAQALSIKLKKMSTTKNKSNAFQAMLAIVFIIGGGVLLPLTINNLYNASPAIAVISLTLLSVFIYILGASLLGSALQKGNAGHSCGGANHGTTFAFLLIAGGLLLLCFNTGMLNPAWKNFFFSWPMLLFVIGATNLSRLHVVSGTILVATGLFFLIEKTSAIYPYDIHLGPFVATYWPALIILLGVLILLGAIFRSGRLGRRHHHKGNWNYTPNEQEINDGKINYQFSFSGTEQVFLDPVFKGGSIDVTFGGMELDLRRTSLAEGDTFLYVKTTFGGVEITAPDNWDIEIRSKAVLGGVSDSRDKNIEKDRTRKLIIVANSTLGGIEIK